MRTVLFSFAVMACAVLFMSCSVPGSSAMSEIKAGMGKEQVRSVMQSHGLNLDDSRKRPSSGWEAYGQDSFAAGSMANTFERETGQRVEWAEVYHSASDSGATVIDLYYDSSGGLIH